MKTVRCEEQVQDSDRFMVQAITLEKNDKEVDAEFVHYLFICGRNAQWQLTICFQW